MMMDDQASALRRKVGEVSAPRREPVRAAPVTRTLAVSGGKGGVGKSNISLNLAVILGSMDREVALLDTDFGLPNLDILLGCVPRYNITDVMHGGCEPEQALQAIAPGVRFMAGGELWGDDLPTREQVRTLLTVLSSQMAETDYLIIDAPAGVGPSVTGLLMASEMVAVVTTAEPPSIMDSYRTIKQLHTLGYDGEVAVVVNRVRKREADRVYRNLRDMVGRFLAAEVQMLAWIPDDSSVVRAVKRQIPVSQAFPASGATRAIRRMALALTESSGEERSARSFLQKLGRLLPVGRGGEGGG